MPKQCSRFYKVGEIINLFVQMGCEIRNTGEQISDSNGDCFGIQYLFNAEIGGFVPIIDLQNDQLISRWEVESWERRLGIEIPYPPER